MSLDTQFVTMAAMAGCGAALGLLFDLYRVLSGELRFPRWILPPLDMLYWAAGTIAVFRVLFMLNGGEVRVYVFLALLIGISFYFGLLGRWSVRLLRWKIRKIKDLLRLIIKLGEVLIVRPIVLLYRAGIVFFGFLAALSIFLFKVVIQLLYPICKLIGWIVHPVVRRLHEAFRANGRFMHIADRISRWVRRWRNKT